MAERARELVASLLNDRRFIDTIANACSSSAPNAQASFVHVEDEVRLLFNRGPQTRAPGPNACSVIHTTSGFNLHLSGMSCPPPPPAQSYNLRRLPRVNVGKQTRHITFQENKHKCIIKSQHLISNNLNRRVQGPSQLKTFTKEVVLLPDNTTIPCATTSK
ncbi:hypothetical protein SRHO_G00019750 [Serrasalmus rhombeus]